MEDSGGLDKAQISTQTSGYLSECKLQHFGNATVCAVPQKGMSMYELFQPLTGSAKF